MKTLAALGFSILVAGVPASAATIGGRLMDAGCYNQKKVESQEAGHKTYGSITKECAATPSSTEFAVRVTDGPFHMWEGETIKLDAEGNQIAANLLKSGELQTAEDGHVHIRASGKMTAGEVMVIKSVEQR